MQPKEVFTLSHFTWNYCNSTISEISVLQFYMEGWYCFHPSILPVVSPLASVSFILLMQPCLVLYMGGIYTGEYNIHILAYLRGFASSVLDHRHNASYHK